MPDLLTIQVRFEDGALWATVEEFPGVFATGDTLEELRESLEEGIALYLSDDDKAAHIKLGPLETPTAMSMATSAQLVPA
jgi:predicted RNase H-like HicB family nuclease